MYKNIYIICAKHRKIFVKMYKLQKKLYIVATICYYIYVERTSPPGGAAEYARGGSRHARTLDSAYSMPRVCLQIRMR